MRGASIPDMHKAVSPNEYKGVTPEEFQQRISELLKRKGKSKAEFIRQLANKRYIDEKSAENYVYGKRMPTSFLIISDIAEAIDADTFLQNLLYIMKLSDIQKPNTHEAHVEIVGNTLNVTVGKNVAFSNIHFNRQDDIEQVTALKMLKDIKNVSSKFVMRFTCTKELYTKSVYPIPSDNYRHKYCEHISMQDNYIIIDGNIYHEDTGHIFGYKHSQHDTPISLYRLAESVSEKKMSYAQFRDCITRFQRTYQRQGAYYGTIGRNNLSINTFSWLSFNAGFLATLGENL